MAHRQPQVRLLTVALYPIRASSITEACICGCVNPADTRLHETRKQTLLRALTQGTSVREPVAFPIDTESSIVLMSPV